MDMPPLARFAPCCVGSKSVAGAVCKRRITAAAAFQIAVAELVVMVGERVCGRNGLKTFTFEKIV
jgi:hypothetical protein